MDTSLRLLKTLQFEVVPALDETNKVLDVHAEAEITADRKEAVYVVKKLAV